jgi:hypothetical protein
MPRIIYTFADHGGEKSSVSLPVDALTDDTTIRAVIAAVTIGELQKATLISDDSVVSSDNAASVWAQVELGLRIRVADTVNGESGYYTIPCPDMDALTILNDQVTLADGGVMAALVTEFEANVLSRDGNVISVTGGEVVGRAR